MAKAVLTVEGISPRARWFEPAPRTDAPGFLPPTLAVSPLCKPIALRYSMPPGTPDRQGKARASVLTGCDDDKIKAEMRSYAGAGDWNSVGGTIARSPGKEPIAPRCSVANRWSGPCEGLTKHEGMPPGVSVATGSNYRECDLHTTESRAPACDLQQSFDIWSGKGAFAFSFGKRGAAWRIRERMQGPEPVSARRRADRVESVYRRQSRGSS